MAEATATKKLIDVLVPVRDAHGSIVTHEWRKVEGTEIEFKGVELKNGDTLILELTGSAGESRDAD